MARRTEALHVTVGDDYVHRLEVILDAVAMDLTGYAITGGLTRGSTAQAFTLVDDDADLGILLFTLEDAATALLEEGLWRFWVRTALDGLVATWLTGPVIVDDQGAGADRTVIEYTDDATTIVLETSGIPIGSGGGGVSDHGALTGLADDDHSQYHTDARGDARYRALSTAIVSADIADGTIVNADINASAGVAVSKLGVTGTPDGTKFLRDDATWQTPAGGGGGVTDHGDLTGLADDDHTQYHTDARGDARYRLLSTGIASADITNGTIVDADVSGSAAIAESKLALASDAAAGTASRRTLGTTATSAAAGDDSRLSDTRTPTDGSVTNAKVNASAGIVYSKLSLTGGIVNADIGALAAIAYGKLALTGSVVNADVSASAAIAYTKLSLTGSIVNADVSASAAIAYSKLALTGGIVNADINAAADIDYSKLDLGNSIVAADLTAGSVTVAKISATGTPGVGTYFRGDGVWGAVSAGSVATDAIWDAAGDLAVGSGGDTAVKLSKGSALQVLRVNSAGSALEYASPVEVLMIAASDETTAITTGTAKTTFRMPYAMTLTAVRASLTTASSSGIPTVDINEGGTTVLSTKLTIDASEKTSTTAAAAAVISDTALADDAEMTIDIDVAGTGATGLKVYLIGTRA